MNYFLFKLQFDTAVHFGGADSALSLYTSEETLRADTLFSALCHETLVQHGEEALEQLCAQVRQGKFLLSDTMPWYGETFYLPKPIAASESTEEVETTLRKKVKKLAWIPVLAFDRYARSLHEGHFTPDEQPESFGTHYEQTKAAVPMQGDTMPYQVGLFRFAPDCGLYFICGFTEDGQDEDLEYLLDWLGATGIGGKVSSGYGKFHVVDKIYLNEPFDEQTEWMYHALSAEHAPYLLLSTSLPQTDELDNALEGASFQLVRRSGFMASDRVETPLKKKTQYALSAGSVLQNRYQGTLYDVGLSDVHPVYRYSKPIFMGGDIMIQQDHLQIFDLTLNVWAPLFVGNGSSYTKKEYMYNTRNGKVSFLDEQKFFSFLVEHDLVDKYGQFMLSEQSNLWAFLTKDCGISDAELKTLTRYQIEVGDALDAEHSLKEIHAFQRDAQGHAYIPGSSIKGALRTAWLLSAVLADRSTGHSLAPNRRATFPEEKYVNQLHLHTLKDESIASDAVNSIFRGIQVSDSLPIPDTQMVLVGKFDALVNGSFAKGSNRGIPMCRECAASGTKVRFKLTLDQSVLKGRITKESLLEAIQQFNTYYEQTYSSHFTPPSGAVNLPQQPHLILGGGSGFFAKSLAYPYLGEEEGLRWTAEQMKQMFRNHKHERDAENGISPHTMKYARFRGRLYPYGYCGVSIL